MKENLLLISGLLSNERLWRHQIQHLSLVAEVQVASPTQNSPREMVEEILNSAPKTFALAGHSMGGWLCLEIMRAAKERVTKLCLLNTSARDDTEEKKNRRLALIEKARKGGFDALVDEIADTFVFHKQAKDAVKEMFLSVGCDAMIRQEEAMLQRSCCLPILATIPCQTLVIHAARDRNFSLEEHQELADKIPNAKLAIIEDSGHMSPLEQPQAVTSLLRCWLS